MQGGGRGRPANENELPRSVALGRDDTLPGQDLQMVNQRAFTAHLAHYIPQARRAMAFTCDSVSATHIERLIVQDCQRRFVDRVQFQCLEIRLDSSHGFDGALH
jgi:hypothetical protein